MKYRRKPIEVEAIQWNGENLDCIFTLTGRIKRDDMPKGQIGIFSPRDKAGFRPASIGDWVVKTPDGDVRPISNEMFIATYEAIKE